MEKQDDGQIFVWKRRRRQQYTQVYRPVLIYEIPHAKPFPILIKRIHNHLCGLIDPDFRYNASDSSMAAKLQQDV